MKCIRCHRWLGIPIKTPFGREEYQCACGVRYSRELVEKADIKEWERIRRFRLFSVINKRSGCPLLLVHSLNGKVVHPWHYKIHRFLVKKGWTTEWA